ncbi:MAG: phytanoyl-CoA dioxygenase family protein [Hyalangium sp.]|uniref:phytanoyl-CoA dioxygenase family protein n=1 Tax=Hyalangium sp. TaxID=2028555 RepID=UPI00389B07DC
MLRVDAHRFDVDSALAHYAEHGYARLGVLLDEEGLKALRERADELMLGRVTYPGLFFQLDAPTGRYEDAPLGLGWQGPSLNYRKLEKLELDPRFRAWLENPLFERIARARIPDDIVIYRAILFHKGEAGGSNLPWHQDGGRLWGITQEPELQIWTALDDAPADGGCLEVVPGSHRGGLVTPLGGVIPPDRVADADAEIRRVLLPAQAGEVVLLHNHLWHRSGPSRTGQRRRAFSVCYMSERIRCVRKKKAPRVFTPVFRHGSGGSAPGGSEPPK